MILIERLAALVPKPHKNLLIYSGVLAPNAKLRSKVVAYGRPLGPACTRADTPARAPVAATDDLKTTSTDAVPSALGKAHNPQRQRHRFRWSEIMKRAFAIDVLLCKHCGGRLELLAVVTHPAAVRATLAELGLPTAPVAPRRPRAQPIDFFDSA
jgi:hypothetical protein